MSREIILQLIRFALSSNLFIDLTVYSFPFIFILIFCYFVIFSIFLSTIPRVGKCFTRKKRVPWADLGPPCPAHASYIWAWFSPMSLHSLLTLSLVIVNLFFSVLSSSVQLFIFDLHRRFCIFCNNTWLPEFRRVDQGSRCLFFCDIEC
jgi:hypothetical protein